MMHTVHQASQPRLACTRPHSIRAAINARMQEQLGSRLVGDSGGGAAGGTAAEHQPPSAAALAATAASLALDMATDFTMEHQVG